MSSEGVGPEIHKKLAGELLESLMKAENCADELYMMAKRGERITEEDALSISCLVFGVRAHLLYHMENKMFGEEDEARQD